MPSLSGWHSSRKWRFSMLLIRFSNAALCKNQDKLGLFPYVFQGKQGKSPFFLRSFGSFCTKNILQRPGLFLYFWLPWGTSWFLYFCCFLRELLFFRQSTSPVLNSSSYIFGFLRELLFLSQSMKAILDSRKRTSLFLHRLPMANFFRLTQGAATQQEVSLGGVCCFVSTSFSFLPPQENKITIDSFGFSPVCPL